MFSYPEILGMKILEWNLEFLAKRGPPLLAFKTSYFWVEREL